MKKILISILVLITILIILNQKKSEFYLFAIKNESLLSLKDFKSELGWEKISLVRPYQKICFDKDCFTSTSKSNSYLVFIKNEKIINSISFNENEISFDRWPSWITRDVAVFKKNQVTKKFEFADPNFFESNSPVFRKFILKSVTGNKPFCKAFLSGNANCFYPTNSDCENDLKDSLEACLSNQLGVSKSIPIRWNEI